MDTNRKKWLTVGWLMVSLTMASYIVVAQDAKALLEKAGVEGGIALVIGGDEKLPRDLAAKSPFYVRLQCSDEKRAMAMASNMAQGELRDRLGVSSHRLDPMPYISNLLNLIVVVSDHGGTGSTPSAINPQELARILAPGGVIATKGTAPASLQRLGTASGFNLYRKPPLGLEEDWGGSAGNSAMGRSAHGSSLKPGANIRWRAEPRHHRMLLNYETMICAGGRMFYKELMEVPAGGGYSKAGSHRWGLFARDAFNGRELWRHEGQVFKGSPPVRKGRERTLAANRTRLFAVLKTGIVCLDAATGRKQFDAEAEIAPYTGLLLHGNVLLVHNKKSLTACSAETGKKLWTNQSRLLPPVAMGMTFANDDKKISALDLATGAEKWSADITLTDTKDVKANVVQVFCSEKNVHVFRSPNEGPAWVLSFNMTTGKKAWSHKLKAPKEFYAAQAAKYRSSGSRSHSVVAFPDQVCVVFKKQNRMPGESKGSSLHVTSFDAETGKMIHNNKSADVNTKTIRCYAAHGAGDYILYGSNIFVNRKTLKSVDHDTVRSICYYGQVPANGYIYTLPFHKGGKVKGIVCAGASELPTVKQPGGKVLKTLGTAPAAKPLADTDWPMYRKNVKRSNVAGPVSGKTFSLKWMTPIGKGSRSFAVMNSRRTGLTQPTAAWGKAFVSDIEGQRVVAVDQSSGKVQWVFPVGSRILFSPTLYKGMCFVGATDGWVYALDAVSGKLIWKLMVAPEERFIGGMDKLESLWPVQADVFIHKNIGYVTAGHTECNDGGMTVLGFEPATGKVLWANNKYAKPSSMRKLSLEADLFTADKDRVQVCSLTVDSASGKLRKVGLTPPGSTHVHMRFLRLLTGNNIFQNARNHGGGMADGRTIGSVLAFNDTISVAQFVKRRRAYYEGDQFLYARKTDDLRSKDPYSAKGDLWRIDPYDMNIDGMVLASDKIYCVGHFAKEKRPSELRVLSATDGKTLSTLKVDVRACYDGMSAAGNKLFVSTRDGKLICFEGK